MDSLESGSLVCLYVCLSICWSVFWSVYQKSQNLAELLKHGDFHIELEKNLGRPSIYLWALFCQYGCLSICQKSVKILPNHTHSWPHMPGAYCSTLVALFFNLIMTTKIVQQDQERLKTPNWSGSKNKFICLIDNFRIVLCSHKIYLTI